MEAEVGPRWRPRTGEVGPPPRGGVKGRPEVRVTFGCHLELVTGPSAPTIEMQGQ